MSTDRPADPPPGAGGPLPLRALPASWYAPEIKEIPLLTLANVLRRLQDTIEEASTIADSIDFAMLEQQAMELEEAKRRWEDAHPGVPYGSSCHCICGLWRHIGLCKGYAELVINNNNAPAVVPPRGTPIYMCKACEADMNNHSS